MPQTGTTGPSSCWCAASSSRAWSAAVKPVRMSPPRPAPGVHPVDQPRPLPGLDRDQRSQRHRSAARRARTPGLSTDPGAYPVAPAPRPVAADAPSARDRASDAVLTHARLSKAAMKVNWLTNSLKAIFLPSEHRDWIHRRASRVFKGKGHCRKEKVVPALHAASFGQFAQLCIVDQP